MVIQRNWKIQSESSTINNNNNINNNTNNNNHNITNNSNNINNNDINNNNMIINNVSSSEDSNSSTISSSKGHNSNFVTNPQMAENVLSRLKQRFGTGLMGQRSCHEAEVVMRSLELLRINIQTAFDKEIDAVVKKFMETYFQPAFKNIKENLGDHVVSDEILIKMSCALIENSKTQYNTRPILSTASGGQQTKNILLLTKNTVTGHTQLVPSSAITKSQTTTILKRPSNDNSTLDGTNMPVVKKPLILQPHIINPQLITQPRRQIFWNTANITTETRFLLDVQANQAFGFGTDGRERLASKHPELIRYLPDAQDRDWLVQQKIIPAQNRNSRFLFLVYDEVIKLGELEVYKKRENLNLGILHAFKIPNFVIQKMKIFFIDLNIKSRGLITNSYSNTSNINSNGAGSVDKIITTSTTINSPSSGSQLRNALLQGSSSSSNENGSQQRQQHHQQQHQQKLVSTTVLTPKPKSSLSSSHATLTALLNSNNNSNDS